MLMEWAKWALSKQLARCPKNLVETICICNPFCLSRMLSEVPMLLSIQSVSISIGYNRYCTVCT